MPIRTAPLFARKTAWFTLALLWSSAWLAFQGWLLFERVVSPLSAVVQRQVWWKQEGHLHLLIGPLSAFLLPVIGLHLIFAWINASAFCCLLLPRLHTLRERLLAFLGQLLLVTLALSLLGAWVYPISAMGDALGLVLVPRSGRWLALGLGIAVSAYFLLWLQKALFRLPRLAQWSAGLLLIVPLTLPLPESRRSEMAIASRPNIILIGVDSLRPDHLPSFGAPFNATPNIEAFVRDSVVFSDALTTQAHTFPATASILTGLYPTNSGARGNLFPPNLIRTEHSIAWRFRSAGWQTVYATDETRFSNVDEVYGFGQVVGPGIGVPDYLMSFVSDTVLVNLVANLAPGRWLFPHLYGNRAVAHAYRPESFSRRLEESLDESDPRPLFLYVHFCSGHWPYEASSLYRKDQFDGMPTGHFADTDSGYLRALAAADTQVGRLLARLKEQGRLDNAVVVLFSDHGEDFGMQKDMVRDEAGQAQSSGLNGHGSSAVREPQVRVLLAWQLPGSTGFTARESLLPVSLIDIAPTLAELTQFLPDGSTEYDGISLASTLAGDSQAGMERRTRFVESSRFVVATTEKSIDVAGVLDEAGSDFGFSSTGRVEVLPRSIGLQIAARERSAWSGTHVALLPRDSHAAPLLLDRPLGIWRSAESVPEAAAPLMAALCEHWQTDAVTAPRCAKWLQDADRP